MKDEIWQTMTALEGIGIELNRLFKWRTKAAFIMLQMEDVTMKLSHQNPNRSMTTRPPFPNPSIYIDFSP
jgi:hypothetical protein